MKMACSSQELETKVLTLMHLKKLRKTCQRSEPTTYNFKIIVLANNINTCQSSKQKALICDRSVK